jgi:hypothetical protein
LDGKPTIWIGSKTKCSIVDPSILGRSSLKNSIEFSKILTLNDE